MQSKRGEQKKSRNWLECVAAVYGNIFLEKNSSVNPNTLIMCVPFSSEEHHRRVSEVIFGKVRERERER
jgi:hypothetical protein